MVQNDFRVKMVAKATIYAALHKKHKSRRRWLVAGEATLFAVVMVLSVVLQTYLEIKPPTYTLDASTYSLIGESRDDTAQYLSESFEDQTFSFAVPKTEQEGGARQHTGRVADAYEASFPKRASDGVSVTDTASKITMTLVPKFRTGEGRKVDGDHIVYPLGAQKLIYTLKYNGLKEDIIVPKYLASELDYTFDLKLPSGVEARLDAQGNIGVYSSDPSLFGEVSFGSDEDRARVDKAREIGEKNHLVMTIPYPIVKDATGQEYTDKASFKLGIKEQRQSQPAADPKLPAEVQEKMKASTTKNVYSLTIASHGLKDLRYPISIDPTMQISNAADFTGVNYEEGLELDSTNNLIKRSNLSGGVAFNAQSLTALSDNMREPALVVHNGALYRLGGCKRVGIGSGSCDSYTLTVEYATINSNGTIGAWTNTGSNLPSGGSTFQATVYNGFMYFHGDNHLTPKYARIGSDRALYKTDGTKGWNTGTIPTISSALAGFIAVNNYLYIVGGTGGSRNATQYAPLNADGSIGTWSTTATLNTPTQETNITSYNGYLYMVSGYDTTVVQYAKLNNNGTITIWNTTTVYYSNVYGQRFMALKGYLYVFGGRDVGGGVMRSEIRYAQINADGSLSAWNINSTSMSSTRFRHSLVTDGTYLFAAGGCTSGNGSFCDFGADVNTVQSFSIKPAGELHGFSNTSNVATARVGHVVVAHSGFIYSIGGCTALGSTSGSYTNCTTATTSVEYGTINANGTVTWNGTTTGINAARWGFAAGAYNGYMYVTGGCEVGFLGACTRQSNSFWAPINANGTLGAWTTDADAFTARSYHGFAAYNGYLYAAGGTEGVGNVNTVYKSAIQTNGSPGAWSTTTAMPVAGMNVTMQAYEGYLYAVNPGANTDVVTAPFTTNGSIGSWTNVIDMNASGQAEVFIERGVFYVYNSGGGTSTQYGYLVGDGTITDANGGTSTLSVSTVTSTTAHDHSNAVASYNGFVYVVSGCNSSTADDCASAPLTTEHSPLNNGGNGTATHAATMTDGTNWGAGRHGHDSVYLNGYIYIASGRSNDCTIGCTYPTITSIRKGTVAANGIFDNWVTAADVPNGGRVNHQMVAVNGYMFVIAGGNSSLTPQNSVYRASISPSDGSLGSWDTLANFPIQVRDHQATVYGNVIVVTGGFDQASATLNNTYYASVDSSGNLSSWTATTALPSARRFHAAVGVGNLLYVLGGLNADTSTIHNDVLVADVAASGALSNWRQVGTLPSGRHAHISAATNGFLYFGQGCNGTTATAVTTCSSNAIDDLWVASIGSNGGIGKWVPAGGGLDGARVQSTSEVINGRLFTLGGCHSGCDATNEVTNRGRFVGLGSIPRIGSFSKRYDFGVGVKPTKLITRGTKRTGTTVAVNYSNSVACGATAFDQPQTILDTGYTGTNAQTITLGTSRTLARCLFLRYTIDDSLSGVFPDVGNESTITDFDVYFTANPGNRLRGGRTFTNGADRGLDAAP